MGGWSKDITRQHAERLGLVNAAKPDSQDICFVPNGDYASVVTKIAPEAKRQGHIVHLDGRILGTHEGIVNYTVGQRRGIGIGGGFTENNDPLYVVGLNADEAKVIVGPKESLARDTVLLKNFNWLVASSSAPLMIDVKLRSITRAMPAKLIGNNDGSAEIILDTPQYGISPGQAAVCKIILLSTIKTQYEKPTYMKALQKIPAHNYFPLTWMQKMKTTASFMFGVTSSDEQNLINTYVTNIDTAYLNWSIDKIIHWQNETYPGNVIHIHGSSDRIFPIQNIKADFVIKNGGHFMLLNKAGEVNDILRKIL